ncbi:hypothetical protein GM415_10805 [Pseudodesulfovibrio cashew]|uniref:Uncharacterized protein n=1 Tax=Pseudodesulfovibrio cashew TaxID=2678688 RepID=A0A6I6JJW2_9BACT|nr:hypothetical protein [Pseudodesulfovibrio cashew]QGY40592.1 hypothetical protein GM415_10805 [Pseudodesulfovibrio cashew]
MSEDITGSAILTMAEIQFLLADVFWLEAETPDQPDSDNDPHAGADMPLWDEYFIVSNDTPPSQDHS